MSESGEMNAEINTEIAGNFLVTFLDSASKMSRSNSANDLSTAAESDKTRSLHDELTKKLNAIEHLENTIAVKDRGIDKTCEMMEIEMEKLRLNALQTYRMHDECKQMCDTLMCRLDELVSFLDTLKQENIVSTLIKDFCKSIDGSMDVSQFNISMVNGQITLNEQSFLQISEISEMLKTSIQEDGLNMSLFDHLRIEAEKIKESLEQFAKNADDHQQQSLKEIIERDYVPRKDYDNLVKENAELRVRLDESKKKTETAQQHNLTYLELIQDLQRNFATKLAHTQNGTSATPDSQQFMKLNGKSYYEHYLNRHKGHLHTCDKCVDAVSPSCD